jgi:hypothetical protein
MFLFLRIGRTKPNVVPFRIIDNTPQYFTAFVSTDLHKLTRIFPKNIIKSVLIRENPDEGRDKSCGEATVSEKIIR